MLTKPGWICEYKSSSRNTEWIEDLRVLVKSWFYFFKYLLYSVVPVIAMAWFCASEELLLDSMEVASGG